MAVIEICREDASGACEEDVMRYRELGWLVHVPLAPGWCQYMAELHIGLDLQLVEVDGEASTKVPGFEPLRTDSPYIYCTSRKPSTNDGYKKWKSILPYHHLILADPRKNLVGCAESIAISAEIS